jgi:hypothetical protein
MAKDLCCRTIPWPAEREPDPIAGRGEQRDVDGKDQTARDGKLLLERRALLQRLRTGLRP